MIEIGGLGNCLTDSEEKSAGWSLIEKLSAAENAKKTQKVTLKFLHAFFHNLQSVLLQHKYSIYGN